MAIVENVSDLQKMVDIARNGRKRIAFVPTMGALHEGHMALVQAAKAAADFVVVSIFVNPKQFGPNEDFDRYPKALEADKALLERAGVNMLYCPSVEVMYPKGFSTTVHVDKLEELHCGAYRPGHFAGVATVVHKLLLQVQPDVALFGEKDFQQLIIIKRMVKDLDIPIEIRGMPTMREADGLALSSRNRYLSDYERSIAPVLYETLLDTASKILAHPGQLSTLLEKARQHLKLKGFTKVDYVSLVHPETLVDQIYFNPPARLMAAVWLGNTRLIDNIPVP